VTDDPTIDTSSRTGKLVMGLLALIAEFENDIRHERQMDGIKKARERGTRFGRKPLLIPETIQQVRKLRKAGKTVPEIHASIGAQQGKCVSSARHVMKTEYQRKQEAKAMAARRLEATKKRLGLGEPGPLRGMTPSPLEASSKRREPTLVPTSDHIPGPVPAKDLLHAHKWKQGVKETTATIKEMHRKAARIAPAYNKGALQYLPGGLGKDQFHGKTSFTGRGPSAPSCQ